MPTVLPCSVTFPDGKPNRTAGSSDEQAATVADQETSEPPWIVASKKPPVLNPNTVKHQSVLSETGLIHPRTHCLMIFQAPESESSDPQIRYEHDVAFLQSLIDKLLDPDELGVHIKRILRLGTRAPNTCRPLRIVFENDVTPVRLLSRLWRLKGLKIHVRADLTLEERNCLRNATIELRQRTKQGENNIHIVNFRVVRKRQLINKPVLLMARAPT